MNKTNSNTTWSPAEREIAVGLRGKTSHKGISTALKEAGYNRTTKAIERFFARVGTLEDTHIIEVKPKGINEFIRYKPLKTTWGDDMLVDRTNVEFGTASKLVPVMIIPDIHAGIHDEKAIELACKIAEIVKPVAMVYLGDNVDWLQLSKFEKDPNLITHADRQISTWQSIDRMFQSAVGSHCKRYYILGNHELRLRKWLMNHPPIYNIRGMQFDAVLGLDEDWNVINNLQFVEEEISWRDGRFIFKHGEYVRKWACYTAKAEMDKEMTNGISGHTHRAAQYYLTNRERTKVWTESGCLIRMDPGYIKNPNWQQAVSVGWFNGNGDNDYFHIDLITFVNHQAIVNGNYVSV